MSIIMIKVSILMGKQSYYIFKVYFGINAVSKFKSYNQIKSKMPKRIIDFHDSVEFTGDWVFVKQRKEKFKVQMQKAINSEIYMTFNEVVPLYTFLYFALAPKEAFEFQKVQPILDKMRSTEEQKIKFEECKKALTLYWDGVTPLVNLIREQKKHIIRQQKSIYDLSLKLNQEQAKQLLRSGLSQRKIHLDYHTNDGAQHEAIIPTAQNINNCISIIYEQKNHKYLLAFFCHIEENFEQIKQEAPAPKHTINYGEYNVPQTYKDRSTPNKPVFNPDDRPLPKPQEYYTHTHSSHNSESNKPMPSRPRQIINPDERILPQPAGGQDSQWTRSVPSHPRQIINPDDRLLPPPPAPAKHYQSPKAGRNALGSSNMNRTTPKTNQNKQNKAIQKTSDKTSSELKKEVVHLAHVAEDKLIELGENAKNFGLKVENRVEQIVDEIKNEDKNWLKIGVSAVIIGMFINTLRA